MHVAMIQGLDAGNRSVTLDHHLRPQTRMIVDNKKNGAAATKLVCLDFDGTIMVYDEPPGHFHPDVITLLNDLEKRGIAWCTNSGRDQYDQLDVLERCKKRGLVHLPVALLCSESLIYGKNDGGYISFEPWNTRVQEELRRLHKQVQELLDPKLDGIVARYRSCPFYIGENYTAFNVPQEDGLPVKLFNEMRDMLRDVKGCMVSRNGGWVAIITELAGKGNILREFTGKTGYARENVIAVGDQFNDLTMLNGNAAGMVGCPGDSIPEVIEIVRGANGYVAQAEGPLGTIEVIRHWLGG